MRRVLFSLALGMLGGCCGDTSASLRVHVVDGETGALIAQPIVEADGDLLRCGDGSSFLDTPVPVDDGGSVIPPPGSDMSVGPPPGKHWCETWTGSVEPGTHAVSVTASGYYATEVQIDSGSEGSTFSCPDPRDSEITVALYAKLMK